MSTAVGLETPDPLDSIYEGRGDEVDQFRPLFTGDVLRHTNGRLAIVLQHPCALRLDGVQLVERVLVAEVRRAPDLGLSGGKFRTDWARESMRIMPLPSLEGDGLDSGVDFRSVDVLTPAAIETDHDRIAILSLIGVDLLQQRWIRHNSRVVVKTATLSEEMTGPFEEADLAAEWCATRSVEAGGLPQAMREFDVWIKEPLHPDGRTSRQVALDNPQTRSTVRRALRNRLAEPA